LNALLEITNSVNKNYKVADLLSQFENVMKDYIGISKLAFINDHQNWDCILKYGIGEVCKDFVYKNLLPYEQTILVRETELKGLEDFDILLPVFHKERPLSYLLIGGINEEEMLGFIQNHVGGVHTIANVVA
ncbi:MAG: hypothetical protein QMC28_04190, partial [Flavobacteriales bacterium]